MTEASADRQSITDLTQLMRESVALQEASLDLERRGTPEDDGLFLEYLVRRNRGVSPDLVIAVANPAVLSCLRYRDQLFPGRPLHGWSDRLRDGQLIAVAMREGDEEEG